MSTEIATVRPAQNGAVMRRVASSAMSMAEMQERVRQLDQAYRGLMQKGTDYDVIPGTQKPTLLQPGAQLLCTYFGFAPSFEDMPSSIEDWDRGFFALTIRCRLSRADSTPVAEGVGSCNSKEDKYRWRVQDRMCPACGASAIRRGAAKFGGGFYCSDKQGGCGANFKGEAADEIAAQPQGRIENPEPWSLHNTILKMAEKRALVAACLNATGASRIFTQDLEDMPDLVRGTVVADAPAIGDDAVTLGEGQRVAKDTAPPPSTWSDALRAQWARGTVAATTLGMDAPEAPPDDAPRAAIQTALRALGTAVQARQSACEAFRLLTAEAVALGVDAKDIDPVTLPADELTGTYEALSEMVANVRAAIAEAQGGDGASDGADDDSPF